MAEECIRALGNVSELLPAFRRLGVEGGSLGYVSGGFDEYRAGSDERVLPQRSIWLEIVCHPSRKLGTGRRDCTAH